MSRTLLAGMLGLGLMACSGAAAGEPEPEHADRWQPGNGALDRTLVVGTLIEATIHSPLSWRRNQPGETLTATVSADVKNANRRVVIPAGSPVGLRIAHSGPATNTSQAKARITLEVFSVTALGRLYPVRATGVVVVAPGTRILFVLSEGFTAAMPRAGIP